MQLTIKDKNYNVKFGVKFVRALDEMYPSEQNGLKFGFSLTAKVPELMAKNIAALADVLYMGTITESPRPSLASIEEFVEEHDNIDALFDEVLAELGKSNAGKSIMGAMEDNLNP